MPISWERYCEMEERDNIEACLYAARKAGYSDKEAEDCEGGELKCPTCPWKEKLVLPIEGE